MHIKIIHETTAALLLSSSPCHGLQASSYYCLVNIQAKFFSKIVDTTSKKSLMRENQKPILVNFHLLFLEYFIVKNHSKKSKLTLPSEVKRSKITRGRYVNPIFMVIWKSLSICDFSNSTVVISPSWPFFPNPISTICKHRSSFFASAWVSFSCLSGLPAQLSS